MATTETGKTTSGGVGQKPRKIADCRLFPSEKQCTLTIAGTEDEVLEVAVQHAITSHGHKNSPELRNQIRAMLKDER
jgi:predicted small metal-binding protein